MRPSLLFLLFLLGSLFTAQATDVRSGQEVVIDQALQEDMYIGAGAIHINAPVGGDLMAAARSCFIRDTIREDAVIFAQEIFLEAPILDDARLVAAQIYIRADIFGDLIIGGGNVEIDPNVTIHGNLYAGAGKIYLRGRVLGNIELAGGEVIFDGIAEGESQLKAGKLQLAGVFLAPVRLAAEEITFSGTAAFNDEVRYWTQAGQVDFSPYLKGDHQARFDESLRTEIGDGQWRTALGVGAVFFTIGRILSAGLLLVLLVWTFRNFFRRTARRLMGQYANSLGYGMLYLLVMPLLILLALVSIIGIPVGIFSLATYGLSLAFAHIFSALLFTFWWQEYKNLHWNNTKTILVAVGVFALLKLVCWVPFIGWLVSFVAIAVTFGAILMELLRNKKPQESTAEQAVEEHTEMV